ncbi:glycoside hydrolase domain-containing protein [Amycolatopsis pigmentata]|uniref:Glycoside hydrolase domain-containing protein n=1 Tax=Amycolatopsis pigmentata TaxID=450801 RepID=A0ABW5FIF8_9PSEU
MSSVRLAPRLMRKFGRSTLVAGVAVALLATGAPVASGATSGEQRVSYLGLDFTVPADWPVISLTDNAAACVRFDRHAVYLGTPSHQQDCPANLIGRTEALLVAPAAASTATSTDNPIAHQITATSPGVSITVVYGSDRALAAGIVTSAGLPAPTVQATAPPTPRSGTFTPNTTASTLPASVTNGSGEGFDTCTAPSSATMSAWLGTYTNVGIYLGGSDMACAQPNLTTSWVSSQAAAGWHFEPLYVGPQAAFNELTAPSSQGVAAADDAVTQASNLGFGLGNVLYYDMEGYSPEQSGAALAFEAAWNSELHKLGYWAGIYGSGSSTLADLVANYGNSATPDVVVDAKWDGTDDTTLPSLPSTAWSNHQRVHQYSGGVTDTHGGYSLSIDKNALDVSHAGTASTPVTSGYTPDGPSRLLDTRGNTAPGEATLQPGGVDVLQVSGTAGVPASATAVVLNVTAVGASGPGYLTVYPDGDARPTSSNLNFIAGQVIANLVTVPITDGKVDFYNFQGTVDVVADLFGYYTNGSGDTFTPAGPTRLLDTRTNGSTLGPGGVYSLPVAGTAGVPANVTAVVLNVTAVNPSGPSYLTVYPDAQPRPSTSNINFSTQPATPNLVLVPVTNGTVDFYNFQGTVDVVADLFGYYTNGSGNTFTPAGPARLLDTRANGSTLGPGGVYSLPVAGTAGVPANVTAVVLNVTVTNSTTDSYLTVYPDGGPGVPTASNLNFVAGQTVPNLAIVPVTDGKVDFYNFHGSVDVIADLFGYFTG